MSFVERSTILCPYIRESTIGGSTDSMSFVERSTILCPYIRESTIGGFTVSSVLCRAVY